MTDTANHDSRRGRRREPLKVELSIVVRTGDAPEDRITIMDNRELRMIGSVFEHRDRIMRFISGMIWRVAAGSPAFRREIAPALFQQLDAARRGRER